MKSLIGNSYYEYEIGKLPIIFKVISSKKNNKLNDYCLRVERFILKDYGIELFDIYDIWWKHNLKNKFKLVTKETVKALKKKYKVKKGFHKIYKKENK